MTAEAYKNFYYNSHTIMYAIIPDLSRLKSSKNIRDIGKAEN